MSNDEHERIPLALGKSSFLFILANVQVILHKHWRISPIDAVAGKHWKAYSEARDAMPLRTHTANRTFAYRSRRQQAPGAIESGSRYLVAAPRGGKKIKLTQPDPDIAFEFSPDCIGTKRLAPLTRDSIDGHEIKRH